MKQIKLKNIKTPTGLYTHQLKSNYTKYKDEIKDLRKLLNDEDYCAGLGDYHSFLSDMHMKLVSNGRVTPKMINAIHSGIKKWKMFYDENEVWKREKLLKKISKMAQICEVHYFASDKNFKLKVIYSIMEQIKTRGFITKKQMRWCNDVYKIMPKRSK